MLEAVSLLDVLGTASVEVQVQSAEAVQQNGQKSERSRLAIFIAPNFRHRGSSVTATFV